MQRQQNKLQTVHFAQSLEESSIEELVLHSKLVNYLEIFFIKLACDVLGFKILSQTTLRQEIVVRLLVEFADDKNYRVQEIIKKCQ